MLAADVQAVGCEEQVLEDLKVDACRLQKQLSREVKPDLARLQQEEASLRSRQEDLVSKLDGIVESRRQATEQLGKISKRQLAEIKQLTRSPPDAIRRTLTAAWLLLHGDRFRGKPVVKFDEINDWPRCQRMLADEAFIPHILNFDVATLVTVPHVPRYVAARFFGMGIPGSPISGCGCGNTPELPQIPGAQPGSVDEPTGDNMSKTASRRSERRNKEKPPLEVEMVAHASEPCGALLKWMLELVREYLERESIEQELSDIGTRLERCERCSVKLKCDAAEIEAKLAQVLAAIQAKEQRLNKLRLEKEAAERATQDLKKLKEATPPSPESRRPMETKGKEKAKQIELELSGSMAHLEHKVAQLRVKFRSGESEVCHGDPEQAIILPQIADLLKAQKGSKFLLEGHCEPGEKDGIDYERCLAVFDWLVEGALCPPGSLRIKGRKAACGEGRSVVPVLIDELIVKSGPVSQDLEAATIKTKPGLFFASCSAELSSENKQILGGMAEWLNMEDDTYIRIEGHIGTNEEAKFAAQRAQAVVDQLHRLGVAKKRLKPTACGNRHPASRLHDELNRRVELHVE
jgi:outer membrane protein OmpA-like peptidoglycan-associated protein